MSRLLPQFGSYQTLRRLGAGGMAETFVAVRHGPGGFEQRVCIKRILPAYESDTSFVEAFLREARTSAALRHANIVQVLDFGLADDSHYLALELIDGLDLRALVHEGEAGRVSLGPELVALIAGDLAAALEHAHTGGELREPIVHRDISPSNVLISRAGEIKLTDFGIARAIGGRHLTATGVIKGKVPYLPPEYIERGRFDERSDLFALGVLMFELLTGQRPFDGETDLDTLRRIVAGERPTLIDLSPRCPPELARCVERLIAQHPEDRFDSARALLEALPAAPVHRARRRLGELVRARLGERPSMADALVTPTEPMRSSQASGSDRSPGAFAPTQAVPLGSSLPAHEPTAPTRTIPSPSRRPSRGALFTAASAALALLTLLLAGLVRSGGSTANVHAASPPVAAPEAEATAAPTPATPVQEAPKPVVAEHVATEPNAPRASGEIRVFVIPFGEVWIDGKPLGHAPVTLRLPPGTHEIGVGDGRPDQQRSVQLRAGAHEKIVFRRDEAETPR